MDGDDKIGCGFWAAGRGFGIPAIIFAIAGIFIWPAGILGLLAVPVSLVFAGLSGLFRNIILSTTSVIITTINSLNFMGELTLSERRFVDISYLFAVTGIIIGVLRNRAQTQREMRVL